MDICDFEIVKQKVMIDYNHLQNIISMVFRKMDFSEIDADDAAKVLVRAELRNIKTHGVVRLGEYYELWKKGRLNPKPDIKILHETPSTALVDADKGLGLVVGQMAMKTAIKKAETAGTGWVAVRNSFHFGIAGFFAMLALEKDMIGISMTNANPLVAPTFSKKPLLGTNPIAIAIPALKHPPFVADFATSPISRGKLDRLHENGLTLPDLIVQDSDGNSTNQADILTKNGSILPLGGDYEHSSHKGYIMSALVDIFSAVFSGANFGPTVIPTLQYLPENQKRPDKGIGHFFGAIRTDAFQTSEDFKKQMDEWIETFKSAIPVEGREKVIIPGEPEREAEQINKERGIKLSVSSLKTLNFVLCELKIEKDIYQNILK